MSQTIINGDCITVLPPLAQKFNLIFADSPYNIGIDYGDGKKADLLSEDDFVDWSCQWLEKAYSKLTDNGSMWVLINDEYVSYLELHLRNILGMKRRNWIILYESFGVQASKKFARTKRHLLYFVRDEKNFIFNPDEVRVPSARLMKYNDDRANPKGKVDEDVWSMTRLCGTFKERIPGFPTQLPLDLLRRIIKVASNEGDWILDPFSGSATSGVACKELKRNFVGVEKNPEYYKKSLNRLKGNNHG